MAKSLNDIQKGLNEKLPFKERAAAFEKALEPLVEQWGITPSAVLQSGPNGIYPIALMADLWQKESGTE